MEFTRMSLFILKFVVVQISIVNSGLRINEAKLESFFNLTEEYHVKSTLLLSRPQLLIFFQVVPPFDFQGELSEPEEDMSDCTSLGSEASLELDKIPRHTLLDCSAAKHKTELVHRNVVFCNSFLNSSDTITFL